MSVVIFYKDFLTSVGDAFDVRAIACIVSRNTSVEVYCLQNKKKYKPFYHKKIQIYEFKNTKIIPPLALLSHIIKRKNDKDLFHLFGGFIPQNIFLAKLLKLKGKPYIFSPLGQFTPTLIEKNKIKKELFIRLFVRNMIRYAFRVHVVSSYEKKCINKIIKIKENKIFIINLGIHDDIVNIFINAESRPRKNNKFLFIGRPDIWQKGLDLLLKALAQNRDYEFSFFIAGRNWNNQHEILNDMIESLSLESKVLILGEITEEEKHDLLLTCDFFFHPSRVEGFARSIREAIAAKIPILTTEESNSADIIRDNSLGIISALNVADLAKNINLIINKNIKLLKYYPNDNIYLEMRWENLKKFYNKLYEL